MQWRSGGLFACVGRAAGGRTARDRNRPLLRTANPEKTLRDLLALRDPLYREIADLVVETDERPPRMVVLDILERLPSCLPVKARGEMR
jgi:shikimate kinase